MYIHTASISQPATALFRCEGAVAPVETLRPNTKASLAISCFNSLSLCENL